MNTLLEMLKAGIGLAILLALWVGVQFAWRRVFPTVTAPDEDILASRLGCHSCTCATPCENRRRASTDSPMEG